MWLASIVCILQIPGSNLDKRLAFFHILPDFYTVSTQHSMLSDFGKMKSSLNRSMARETATNFYNDIITSKVRTSAGTNDNLSVSVVYILPPSNSSIISRWSTASRGVWHPTCSQEPALREHLTNELFNNRTVLVR